MKKFLSLFILIAMVFALTACSSGGPKKIEGNLSDIMAKIIETADVDEETRTYVLEKLSLGEVPAENAEYFLGKPDYVYKEAYSAEPMMTAQAFSLVLVRANSESDALSMKDELKKTADPRKWICVGVDESDVKTASAGDVVLLVMAENSQSYIDAFNSLAK